MDHGNLSEKFSLFSEHWQPKIIGSLNGQEVKIVKVQGVFPWHHHADLEEMFLVWRGRFRVEFCDHIVEMGPGDYAIVPRGVEHRTAAEGEAEILIFEPADTRNTGNLRDDTFTAPGGVRL